MFKLVIDANILVSELLRQRGRELFNNGNLEIYATEKVIEEANHEIAKRIHKMMSTGKCNSETGVFLSRVAFQTIETCITVFPSSISSAIYIHLGDEAKERIPRDPDDWYTVALAIHLNAAIWTQDNDFLGCGCPTWTTDTLIKHIKRYFPDNF